MFFFRKQFQRNLSNLKLKILLFLLHFEIINVLNEIICASKRLTGKGQANNDDGDED